MKALIWLLFAIIIQVNGSCLKIEDCMKNVTNAFLAFGEHYSRIMFHARDYIKVSVPKFKTHYDAFKTEVNSGPETCRKEHAPNKKMGYYLRDAMNVCLVPQPDPNQEDVDSIKNMGHEVFAAGDNGKYCEHLVAYFSIYCRYLDEVMVTAGKCDVVKNFDEMFKSKWIACLEKTK